MASTHAESAEASVVATMQATKRLLRKAIAEKLSGIPATALIASSAAISDAVTASTWYRRATAVSLFLSMPTGEVQTTGLLQRASREGKMVFVPKVVGKRAEDMRMLHVDAAESVADFPLSPWGIPEPAQVYSLAAESAHEPGSSPLGERLELLDAVRAACEHSGRSRCAGDHAAPPRPVGEAGLAVAAVPDVFPLLVCVPGVAFDACGRRLGHGKGYYDAYMRRLQEAAGSEPRATPEACVPGDVPGAAAAAGTGKADSPLLFVALALDEQMLPSEGAACTSAAARASCGPPDGSAAGAHRIPTEPHDQLVDLIVTPTRVIDCRQERLRAGLLR